MRSRDPRDIFSAKKLMRYITSGSEIMHSPLFVLVIEIRVREFQGRIRVTLSCVVSTPGTMDENELHTNEVKKHLNSYVE